MITSDDLLTLTAVKKYYNHWYTSAQDPGAVECMGAEIQYDLLTPLAKGKEWLYELTQQHQPRTGSC